MPRRNRETSSQDILRTPQERNRIGSALFMANVMHGIIQRTEDPVFRPIFQQQYYDLLEKAGVRILGGEILIPDVNYRRFNRIKIQFEQE